MIPRTQWAHSWCQEKKNYFLLNWILLHRASGIEVDLNLDYFRGDLKFKKLKYEDHNPRLENQAEAKAEDLGNITLEPRLKRYEAMKWGYLTWGLKITVFSFQNTWNSFMVEKYLLSASFQLLSEHHLSSIFYIYNTH